MSKGHTDSAGPEPVATLVRSVPVRVTEVSRGGCRLECTRRLATGSSGQLTIEMDGQVRVDDIHVTRCHERKGAGAVYDVGAELLRTRRLSLRSVRMAVAKIIGARNGGNHDPINTCPDTVDPKT